MNKRRASSHKKEISILIVLCVLIGFSLLWAADIETKEIKRSLAEAYVASGDYAQAEKILKGLIEEDPQNLEAKVSLADAFAYKHDFDKAVILYQEILNAKKGLEIKKKLADVLSWDKRYAESLGLYDEILKEKEDTGARLQKARILGWDRRYAESLKEYHRIYDASRNELIGLEMKAKEAYWNNRIKNAASCYSELIKKDPANVEAMFDLSQVYAYQSIWQDALQAYQGILDISPNHFRAKQGLKKTKLISEHCSLKSGYEFFEADSTGRDQDIRRNSFFNEFNYPVNYNLNLNTTYRLTHRSFADFSDLLENEVRIKASYINNPDWSVSGFYDFIAYNRGINPVHTFGAGYGFRILDCGISNFSYERERLENNSTVIRGRFYSDNYKERLDMDINKRLKLGIDYLFASYSDSNYKLEPGLDLLYYFSLDPKRLTVKYRYFYKNFDKKVSDYFSPKGFSTNSLALNWRHFLNKEEIFFGADDLYYDLGYEITVDSKNVVGNKFSAGLNWDINKRLNINIKGSVVNSAPNVYRDKSIIAAVKYYF